MFKTLLRQDVKVLLRDRSLPLVLLMALASVFYGVWSGSDWKARQLQEFQGAQEEATAAQAREAAQLTALEKGELDLRQAAAAGLPNAVKTTYLLPPGPLAEFAIGNADLRPRKADIAAMGRAGDMFRAYQIENPALLALGRFDLAFFTVYLLPLLILGLSYSVLSLDRESGSLALLLAQPLTAAQLAWARIGVRTAIVVLVVVGANVVAWLLFSPNAASFESAARLAAWCAVTSVYGLFWGSLAGLVVARNGSSETNALVLLLAWAVFTLILPALISILAQTMSPVPSRLDYITTARGAENEANAQAGELLQGYLLDHPEIEATQQSAVAPFIKTFVLVQRRVEDAVAPISAEFDERLDEQQRIAGALAFLSPASLVQTSLTALAGTSLARQRRFEAESRSLRGAWLEALQPPIVAGRRLTSAELAALPRPSFQEAATGDALRRSVTPVMLLLAYACIFLVIARRRFRSFIVSGA